jgi:hypothetical protein
VRLLRVLTTVAAFLAPLGYVASFVLYPMLTVRVTAAIVLLLILGAISGTFAAAVWHSDRWPR